MSRRRRRARVMGVLMLGLALGGGAGSGATEEQWAHAIEPWAWTFPRDHGAHPEFRTEWWYFTGNLSDAEGNRYGYQLTFFRQGVRREVPDPANAWSVRDVYLAHLAVADGARGRFRWAERSSRAGPGLAGASSQGMDVWLLNWSARMSGGEIALEARAGEMAIALSLRPRKPVVLHGPNGLSQKGPDPGQASYYASFTDLKTAGTLRLGERALAVQGTSWFDQEFGSNQLAPDQVGWDWFSLHLSDGQDLMIYFLRLRDGSTEPASSGTLVAADGSSRHLRLTDIRVSVLDRWKGPRSGGQYPSRWRIEIPSAGIGLDVTPLLPDQELVTEGSTGVTYWEGMVMGKGTSQGQPVTCEGYVEMTGYAGGIGGLF